MRGVKAPPETMTIRVALLAAKPGSSPRGTASAEIFWLNSSWSELLVYLKEWREYLF
jgi:hypothetical protein